MNKRTPVPGYRLLPILSTKLQLKDNHYYTPCTSCRTDSTIWEIYLGVFDIFNQIRRCGQYWYYFLKTNYYFHRCGVPILANWLKIPPTPNIPNIKGETKKTL